MKRVVPLLALLASCACGHPTDRQFSDLFDSARLALGRGELIEAQTLAARGSALARAQPDAKWPWTFRLLRAEILIAGNKLAEVPPLLGATLPSDARFAMLRSKQKYLDARLALAQGKLSEASDLLERARELAPPSSDVRLDIDVLDGQVRFRLGRWADGESTLSAVVIRAGEINDRYHQMLALNNLGMGRVVRNRFDEALPWFERVLSFTDLEQFTVYAVALYNAGICYARVGEFERALALQRRAVDIHERHGSRGFFEQALGELGSTYILQGNIEQGLLYLQRALVVASDANLAEDAAVWGRNLADAYVDLGRWGEAERFNEESKRLNPPALARKLVHNTLASGNIAAGQGLLGEAARLFSEAAARSDQEFNVRWEAHAGLAGVALARKQPDRAAYHFEAALDAIEKTRADLLKTDYKLSYLNRLIRFYQQYVGVLVDEGQVDRALEIADSSRGRVLADKQGVAAPVRASGTALRRLAQRSGTVWLSYWLAPSRSYVWVVNGAAIHYRQLPPAKEIETLVHEHQAVVANALADPLASRDTAGDKLYHLLVEPVARWMPRDASVIIVPDGALHGLNFETLPVDGARRHYWIEDVEVQIAPSLASLTAVLAADTPKRSLLLVGDPTPRPPEFPALGYAATEMTNVARHFEPSRVVTFERDRASPDAYRRSRPNEFAFVHFTAHASANVESPLDSAVILSGPNNAYKLYARDVADERLHAELVTVSACRSAGERAYSGEGLVGFSWAFLRAGARRVIAGLWDVDDRSTADLMDQLYARLAAGDSAARALRTAKLGFIRRGGMAAKPYYWAPFELFTVAVP
jgi:CHAT domain-containing protein/tetratricopeptide (TPR) repeat protein